MKQCFKVHCGFGLDMGLAYSLLLLARYHNLSLDEISCFYVLRRNVFNIKVAMYSITHRGSLANITYQIT